MDAKLVQKAEAKLYRFLAKIPVYPSLSPLADLSNQVVVMEYKERTKEWLKTSHPRLYKQPIIPELTSPEWAEQFGMNILGTYQSMRELLAMAPVEVPFVRLSYHYPCNWELEQLQKHCAKFLRQFRRYYFLHNPTLLSAEEWELLILMHDLGKPRAIERSYQIKLDKKQQKADNDEVRAVFWQQLRPGIVSTLAQTVIDLVLEYDTLLYEYLSQPELNMVELATQLRIWAEQLDCRNCDVQQLLWTFYVYYLCDGSTYTVHAGGLPSFDFQFIPVTENFMRLWPPFATRSKILFDLLS